MVTIHRHILQSSGVDFPTCSAPNSASAPGSETQPMTDREILLIAAGRTADKTPFMDIANKITNCSILPNFFLFQHIILHNVKNS